MISIADRFSFTLTEIEHMKLRKLNYWYNAVVMLSNSESGAGKGDEQ